MTVSATGNFGKAAEALKALVDASSTFVGGGLELITEGAFDNSGAAWALGDSWSISAEKAFFYDAVGVPPGNLEQDIVLLASTSYLVTYEISSIAGGAEVVTTCGSVSLTNQTTDGNKSEVIETGATPQQKIRTSVLATPSSFKIDNVSVKRATSVFIGEYNPGSSALADCFAVIQRSGDVSTSIANTHYVNSGEMVLILERSIPTSPTDYTAAGSESDAEQDFYNFIDGVIDDCQTLSGTAGYLVTRSWTINEVARIDTADRFFAKITVAWGLATS